MNLENVKFPIGKVIFTNDEDGSCLKKRIAIIKEFPTKIDCEIASLSNKELAYKYRPKGWTIKQIVAHCLDSHMHSFIRFKLALTEENPTIKTYKETQWANLTDTLDYDIQETLLLLKGIHKRWVFLLESLTKKELEKTFTHPDGNEVISLKENIAIYSWHCEHHLQHIINAKESKY